MTTRFLLILLATLALAGCEKTGNNKSTARGSTTATPHIVENKAEARPVFHNYTLTGDLEAISKRGYLRLLAPRMTYTALPRNSMPSEMYRQQAEIFARSLDLTPQWVYVDSYAELIPALTAGTGDVIATNFTYTAKRQKQVAFTRSLNSVDEILVHPSGQSPDLARDTLRIGIAEGTAYYETAAALQAQNPAITLVSVAGNINELEVLNGISEGRYDATIIDSNLVSHVADTGRNLTFERVVNGKRELAWAVRKNNPVLKNRINQFLTSHSVLTATRENSKRDWPAIRQSGLLRVITMNSPESYFILRGELMGFDYDLIKHFAKQHDLRLQIIVRESPEAMIESLLKGEGDVIAGSMTVTEKRRRQGVVFSRRYMNVTEKLVGHKDSKNIETLQDMNGITVVVNPHASYHQTLKKLQESGINFTINTIEGVTAEQLINAVARQQFDYTVADSHMAQMEVTYRNGDIKLSIPVSEQRRIAWGLRADQEKLKAQLGNFIRKEYRGLFYNITYKRYFETEKNITRHYQERVVPGKAISPYDDLIKRYAEKHNTDWRLLASQIYQESRFNPKARSYAGARGLMQLLPRTARSFGYTNLEDPQESIAAGLAFKEWLQDRFPADLPLQEKTYFTLAAYNAGHGHVHDARRLARQMGKNPNRWFNNVEDAMLKLSRPEYYRNARYGYVRGSEPVGYVRQIRDRYLAYVEAYQQ